MFDNRTRLYADCTCGNRTVLVKSWQGPTPNGTIRCPKCESELAISTFRFAFKGLRWADRWYAKQQATV